MIGLSHGASATICTIWHKISMGRLAIFGTIAFIQLVTVAQVFYPYWLPLVLPKRLSRDEKGKFHSRMRPSFHIGVRALSWTWYQQSHSKDQTCACLREEPDQRYSMIIQLRNQSTSNIAKKKVVLRGSEVDGMVLDRARPHSVPDVGEISGHDPATLLRTYNLIRSSQAVNIRPLSPHDSAHRTIECI